MVLGRDQPRIFYAGEEVLPKDVHVVIPRIGASITGYGLSVVNQFDMMGVRVLNAIPIARSRDKLRALQLLSRFGIDIPRTVMCRYREEVPQSVEMVGGLPCIIKLIQGTQGIGVMIAHTTAEGGDARHALDAGPGDPPAGARRRVARQGCPRARGGRSRGRRHAPHRPRGEFRSNIHRGGVAEAALEREFAEVAVKAARVMGLEVAGVDMLEARTGPKIMEVNSSPASRGSRPPRAWTSRRHTSRTRRSAATRAARATAPATSPEPWRKTSTSRQA